LRAALPKSLRRGFFANECLVVPQGEHRAKAWVCSQVLTTRRRTRGPGRRAAEVDHFPRLGELGAGGVEVALITSHRATDVFGWLTLLRFDPPRPPEPMMHVEPLVGVLRPQARRRDGQSARVAAEKVTAVEKGGASWEFPLPERGVRTSAKQIRRR